MASMSNRPNRTAGDQPQQRSPDRFDRVSNRSDRRSSRSDRARAFLAARPWIVDTLLWALPIAYVTVIFTLSQSKASEIALVPVSVQVGIVLVQTLPLGLRRTAPLLSSSLIAIGCLLTVLTMTGPTFGIVAVPLTVYSTTAWGTRNHGCIVLVLGLLGAILLGGWLYLVSLQATIGANPRPLTIDEYVLLAVIVALCTAIVLIAWLLGGVGFRRRQEIEGIRERNRLLERERESETRLAADAERMRIAREMHDVIAHSLSVVIAQADGGRYAAKTDPSIAAGALETIARTGREALAQTRSLLGFLRADEDDERSSKPLPGIADIGSLVADVRSAGLPVSMTGLEDVETGRLPEGASLAVYRIVQEALTNVLKHAGDGARAHVELLAEGAELITRISDNGTEDATGRDNGGAGGHGVANGSGHRETSGRGHGILGMQERAALYGGTLTARRIRSTGMSDRTEEHTDAKPGFSSGAVAGSAFGSMTGFLVEARLPLSAPTAEAEPGKSVESGENPSTEVEETSR
jgi:signal transduction histidine kinase